jgi:hypothetical protein
MATWKLVLQRSLYLTAVPRTIACLWFVSPVNFASWIVKKKSKIEWNWLAEVYQGLIVALMLWALWRPPSGSILTILLGVAFFRPFEILVFILDCVLAKEAIVSPQRSLVGFIVNQVETVMCFAVLLSHFGCVKGPARALYNSLRTAVTIGPTDDVQGCYRLVGAEIIVAYLLTILVVAAVVGKIDRSGSAMKT